MKRYETSGRRHRSRKYSLRVFVCPTCAQVITAPKPQSRTTANGHIKHMWCPRCKSVQGFVQVASETLK